MGSAFRFCFPPGAVTSKTRRPRKAHLSRASHCLSWSQNWERFFPVRPPGGDLPITGSMQAGAGRGGAMGSQPNGTLELQDPDLSPGETGP